MIDAVLKSLGDFFGEQILAWIIVSGYIIYLLVFFQKDIVSDDVWDKFQWGDRVLIGVIFGTFYYIAFVLPITLYFERFYRFVFFFNKRTTIEDMKDVIFMFGFIFSLAILLLLRKKSNIRFYSEKGIDSILEFIYKALPFYTYTTLALSTLELTQYTIINKLLYKYKIIESHLLLENILNLIQSVLFITGLLIILSIIEYLNFSGVTKIKTIFNSYVNNINIKRKRILSIRIWILIWIIIGITTTLSFSYSDSKVAIVNPIITTINDRIENNIHLYRNPVYGKIYYAKTVHEDIEIKFPFFTNFKTYIIKNPSNFSSSYLATYCEGPYTYDDTISISHILENQYIKYLEIESKDEIKSWNKYIFTLHYEIAIKPSISIFESSANLTSLGNGTYRMRYSVTIDNDSSHSLYSHFDFSTIKITPFIMRNITISYYENYIEKSFEEYMYDIKNGYFYPVIYVPPNTNIRFSYDIIGVH